jgi:hypothetical protein
VAFRPSRAGTPLVGRYHIMDISLILASQTIITKVGQYHMYIGYVIAHLVLASHANNTMVGRYHIYV